jgi:DNA-binding transcriptional ArsR family regulator
MLERSRAASSRHSKGLDQVFRALAHPVRREILGRMGSGEKTITELAEPFDMTLEAVSQHVRVLERAKLLRRTRHGREHRCRLQAAPLRDAGAVLVKLAGFWDQQLASLDRWLRAGSAKE